MRPVENYSLSSIEQEKKKLLKSVTLQRCATVFPANRVF